MEGHILGQRHGEVKAQGQVGVPLGKAVDLLFRLAAGLGQQHLAGLDDGGVQGGEAVAGVGLAEQLHHSVKLGLSGGEQLHEPGQGAGFLLCHGDFSFRCVEGQRLGQEADQALPVLAQHDVFLLGIVFVVPLMDEVGQRVPVQGDGIQGPSLAPLRGGPVHQVKGAVPGGLAVLHVGGYGPVVVDGDPVQVVGQRLSAQGADQPDVILEQLLVVQPRPPVWGPDVQPRLAAVVHGQAVEVEPGVVADHRVEVFAVKGGLEDGVLLRRGAPLLRLLRDAQVFQGAKLHVIARQQGLKAPDLGGVGGSDQDLFHGTASRQKNALPPQLWDESVFTNTSWCHPHSAGTARPLAFWCGKGTGPSPGPLSRRLSRPPAVSASSHGAFLCPAAWAVLIRPQRGVFNCRFDYTFRGAVGFKISRQSKSPRARPWMSISAEAALVAMGTLCWSHRLMI